MRATYLILAIWSVSLAAARTTPGRIIGGSDASITHYPMAAAMLRSSTGVDNFVQTCGGTIINNRAILSASHCYTGSPAVFWRARVGSRFASSGGIVHQLARIYHHPEFNGLTIDSDVAVIHARDGFLFSDRVRPAHIAGAYYSIRDNEPVWAIGWGYTSVTGPTSETLQHVQVWTINQDICRSLYTAISRPITENMLCSGYLHVGGRDQCQGDSGGPLLHNNIVVGISSWGLGCGEPHFPGVNVRVSRFARWIVECG